MSVHPRPPLTTYRLQLHAGFTFDEARKVVPYLSALGVTDVYLSPPFAARPGSTHGYDVTNHNQLNPELGGREGFDALAAAVRAEGLGLILDFVPNHMGNDARTNAWWRDVLENGPSSPMAPVFDIDWDPIKPELKHRLLLPILGEPYGEALEHGRLRLALEDGALVLCYYDHRLPINPRRARLVYEWNVEALTARLGDDHPDVREFLSILTALRNLPVYTVDEPSLVAERQREKEVARDRLLRLLDASADVRQHIDAAVTRFNGTVGDARSFDALHDLLDQQPYRLAHWRTAADEINYRRFFDINDLAGLRVEDARVFDHIHQLVLELIAGGQVTGLRLDHVDGLSNPAAYLARLQAVIARACGDAAAGDAPGSPFWVVVEKILSGDEQLPADWAVAGTSGYNFLNEVNGLFIDSRQQRRLHRLFVGFTGQGDTIDDLLYESKRVIIGTAMSSEFQVLASAVNRLSESDRASRDFTFGSIRRALREIVACFPVYRTYVTDRGVSASDRAVVAAAIAAARARNPAMESSIFRFLARILLPEPEEAPPGAGAPDLPYAPRLEVARKFQQYTAPVQAKGVEDTAFYRYNALLSLNEVGSDPDRFGRSVAAFHAANAHRRTHWPLEMNATATHDTKRGEDARARLNALSELPGLWREAVSAWARINRRLRVVGTAPAPDRNDEYHYYQVLLAVWPPERHGDAIPAEAPAELVERLSAYMLKAIREAKVHTSWVNQNVAYEAAMQQFVERTLSGAAAPAFLASFVPFARRVARIGAVNALAQVLLKVVSPGVPDFYQGTEFWDLTLVDPDNRRAVDYASRAEWLAEMAPAVEAASEGPATTEAGMLPRWLEDWTDARIKLFVTAAGLRLRRAHPATFRDGAYVPLQVHGLHETHLVACGRGHEDARVVAVVPRLAAGFLDDSGGLTLDPSRWADTRVQLPEHWRGRQWRHLLTGHTLAPIRGEQEDWLLASALLDRSPVALLRAD